MIVVSILRLLALIPPATSLSLPTTNQQSLSNHGLDYNHGPLQTRFRDIEYRDLDAATTLIIEAFSPSAAWKYLMPDLKHHKAGVWDCLRDQLEYAWQRFDRNTTMCKVITVPSSRSRSSGNGKLPESVSSRTKFEEELWIGYLGRI